MRAGRQDQAARAEHDRLPARQRRDLVRREPAPDQRARDDLGPGAPRPRPQRVAAPVLQVGRMRVALALRLEILPARVGPLVQQHRPRAAGRGGRCGGKPGGSAAHHQHVARPLAFRRRRPRRRHRGGRALDREPRLRLRHAGPDRRPIGGHQAVPARAHAAPQPAPFPGAGPPQRDHVFDGERRRHGVARQRRDGTAVEGEQEGAVRRSAAQPHPRSIPRRASLDKNPALRQRQRMRLASLLLALLLTACATARFERVGEDPASYAAAHPYYAEYCALSQIKKRPGFGADIRGEIGGHAVFYLQGACRDPADPYPVLRVCANGGAGLSMNAHFRNAKWVATPGRDFFFDGNLAPATPVTRQTYASVQREAKRLGIYDGVVFHDGVFDDMPAGWSREDWKYEISVGTDYAVGIARGRYCARVPVDRAAMRRMVDFLNAENAPYRAGAVFHWNVFSDNCIHLAHNALAAAGLWAPWPTHRPFLISVLDFPVPRNEFVNLMRRTNDDLPADPGAAYEDEAARRSLLQYDALPTRPGALAESRPPLAAKRHLRDAIKTDLLRRSAARPLPGLVRPHLRRTALHQTPAPTAPFSPARRSKALAARRTARLVARRSALRVRPGRVRLGLCALLRVDVAPRRSRTARRVSSSTHLVLIPSYNSGPLLRATVAVALAGMAAGLGRHRRQHRRLRRRACRAGAAGHPPRPQRRQRGRGANRPAAGRARRVHPRARDGRRHAAPGRADPGLHGGQRRAAARHDPGPAPLRPRRAALPASGAGALANAFAWRTGRRTAGGRRAVRVPRLSDRAAARCASSESSGMRGFEFDAEALIRLAWRGVPALMLPVPVRYLRTEEGGVSHYRYGRDNLRLAWIAAAAAGGRGAERGCRASCRRTRVLAWEPARADQELPRRQRGRHRRMQRADQQQPPARQRPNASSAAEAPSCAAANAHQADGDLPRVRHHRGPEMRVDALRQGRDHG